MKSFKFRAECLYDVVRFLDEWRNNEAGVLYKITIESTEMPDVEVTLEGDTSFEQIMMVMSSVPDSHIMWRTLAFTEKYTGEEVRHES